MTDLPEHPSCDPDGGHCLGCCPGAVGGCLRPAHQPPRGAVSFSGMGLLSNAWDGAGMFCGPVRLATVYGDDRVHVRPAPRIGGPSK